MKIKFYLIIALVICFSIIPGFYTKSFGDVTNTVTLNKKVFELKYSNCTNSSETCLNEYYKHKESNTKWTELFTVVYVKGFKKHKQLTENMLKSVPYAQHFIAEKDYDIIAFMLPYTEKNNDYVELNVAKVITKGKNTYSMQYAKRLKVDKDNLQKFQEKIMDITQQYITILQELPLPEMTYQPLKKW